MVSLFSATSFLNNKNSGLDVYDMVSKTMQSQNTLAPKLNAALSSDKTRLSGLGQLQSQLASFQGTVKALTGAGISTSASSSASNVVTASTSASSVSGSYAVQVDQLAQSQVLNSKPLASKDAAIGSGTASTLKIDLGTSKDGSFTPSTRTVTKTITIDSSNNNLQGIAAAINAANIGVTASVTLTASGFVLSVTSPVGSDSSMRLSVAGDPVLQGLIGYNPAGAKNLTQQSEAKDAALTVNGVAKTSASNTVTDAIPGTTLTLAGKGSSNLTISQNPSQIVNNVNGLVSAYNTLNSKLTELQKGDLQGDQTAARIQGQLARILTATSASNDGSYLNLSKLGISTLKNGNLAVDADTLKKAVSSDPSAAASLFTGGGKGLADKINSQIDGLLGTSGSIKKQTDDLNKDVAALNVKRNNLQKSLTAQAQALAKQYSQQGQGLGGIGQSASGGTLFDYMT